MGENCYNAPALRKGIELVELLAASEKPLTLTEITQALASNANMTTRLIRTLQDMGWIYEQTGKAYVLSMQPLTLFRTLLDKNTFRSAAQKHAISLWEESGECVHISQLSEDKQTSIMLDSWETTRHMIRIAPAAGSSSDLFHLSGSGKLQLAWQLGLFDDYKHRGPLVKKTATTITSYKRLQQEVQLTKERGWGVDNEEGGEGILCLSAPIFDMTNTLAGTICMSVLKMYYPTIEHLIQTFQKNICATAAAISHELGYRKN